MKRKSRSRSLETKLRAVQMFLEEKKSQKEIAEYFGVAVQRVKDWVWIYRHKGELRSTSSSALPFHPSRRDTNSPLSIRSVRNMAL